MKYRITLEDFEGDAPQPEKVIIETNNMDREDMIDLFKRAMEVLGFVFPIEEEQ